jgi:predicted nuclease of predicted toxin-antitoxin system
VKFLLDENVDVRLAALLQERGHQVTSIVRDYEHGLPDSVVLAIATGAGSVLVTHDRDFGELVHKRGQSHAGVVYLRIRPPDINLVLARFEDLLVLPPERLAGFIVLTRTRIRESTD